MLSHRKRRKATKGSLDLIPIKRINFREPCFRHARSPGVIVHLWSSAGSADRRQEAREAWTRIFTCQLEVLKGANWIFLLCDC